MIGNALLLAVREIRRNVMRSILTILGIVIGVAAVITMVTIGEGATVQVEQQIKNMGSNMLMMMPGKRLGPGLGTSNIQFKEADAEAIARIRNSASPIDLVFLDLMIPGSNGIDLINRRTPQAQAQLQIAEPPLAGLNLVPTKEPAPPNSESPTPTAEAEKSEQQSVPSKKSSSTNTDPAETTTTIWSPWARYLATRAATFLMRPVLPTEVPPYF